MKFRNRIHEIKGICDVEKLFQLILLEYGSIEEYEVDIIGRQIRKQKRRRKLRELFENYINEKDYGWQET